MSPGFISSEDSGGERQIAQDGATELRQNGARPVLQVKKRWVSLNLYGEQLPRGFISLTLSGLFLEVPVSLSLRLQSTLERGPRDVLRGDWHPWFLPVLRVSVISVHVCGSRASFSLIFLKRDLNKVRFLCTRISNDKGPWKLTPHTSCLCAVISVFFSGRHWWSWILWTHTDVTHTLGGFSDTGSSVPYDSDYGVICYREELICGLRFHSLIATWQIPFKICGTLDTWSVLLWWFFFSCAIGIAWVFSANIKMLAWGIVWNHIHSSPAKWFRSSRVRFFGNFRI